MDKTPPPGETADFLVRAKGVEGAKGAEIRDNFYSALCTKLARGAACVWAVRQAGAGAEDGAGAENGAGAEDGAGTGALACAGAADGHGGNNGNSPETDCGNDPIIATAGAYALTDKTAYLATIETVNPLRGKGIGSWLVGVLAAQLAGEGRRVTLLCAEERTAFYGRLGFETEKTIWRCTRKTETESSCVPVSAPDRPRGQYG
ncbi:MAG: GNAT family N-acetyltransferase [Subdoligranulum sp.]|nr:GNAT family N-acetyltransferase [Subdoligranulum sp.]